MSLFKSREWWEINLNENEMYDSKCFCTLKLDKDNYQSILLGSHDGFLRLYSPTSDNAKETVTGFKPSHLLLEIRLPSPILQIDEGVLVSGCQDKQLAVLHPRLFSVYTIKKKESNQTNVGDQMVMELSYQHVLRQSAHSFVLGFFGGGHGRQFVCIQALDGHLSFYEQESFVFQLYLPNFLLPFAFTYLDKIDSFLFLNGLLNFECYPYECLASAGEDKKIAKSWEFSLGEDVVEVQTLKKGGLVIICLTEKNVYGLNENGLPVFAKRLQYRPVAMCTYITQEDKNLMIVIASDERTINIYHETTLKWSLKINQTPVCMQRVFLNKLPGGLVLLSENGHLQCVYIGTHPSVYFVVPLPQSEINTVTLEGDLREYENEIENKNPVPADLLQVNVKVDKTCESLNGIKMCKVLIGIDNPSSFINSLHLSIHIEPPLKATNSSVHFTNLPERTTVESEIYSSGLGIPSSLEIQIIISYISGDGVARCIQKRESLPPGLVLAEAPPIQDAQFKLTIGINRPIIQMQRLFKEFSGGQSTSNVVALKFFNSDDIVTILAAKSSRRYRLQADSYPAMCIPLLILVRRLKQQYLKDSGFDETLELTNFSSLPLDSYYDLIRQHHSLIKEKKLLEEKLSKETSQFTILQRKVLQTLKDGEAKCSIHLRKLLASTTKMILLSLNQIENAEERLFLSKNAINSFSRLLCCLMELANVGTKNKQLMNNVFDPFIDDFDNQGWLEVQEATTSFVLRKAVTAKPAKEERKPIDVDLKPLQNTLKLTKHFSVFIDRIAKRICDTETVNSLNNDEAGDSHGNSNPEENYFDELDAASTGQLASNISIGEGITRSASAGAEGPGDLAAGEGGDLKAKAAEEKAEPTTTKYVGTHDADDDAIWDVHIAEMNINI